MRVADPVQDQQHRHPRRAHEVDDVDAPGLGHGHQPAMVRRARGARDVHLVQHAIRTVQLGHLGTKRSGPLALGVGVE